MLAELGSSQVHSSSWLRQEFTETSFEIFLAAIVSICTALHHICVCFVKTQNCWNCMVNVMVCRDDRYSVDYLISRRHIWAEHDIYIIARVWQLSYKLISTVVHKRFTVPVIFVFIRVQKLKTQTHWLPAVFHVEVGHISLIHTTCVQDLVGTYCCWKSQCLPAHQFLLFGGAIGHRPTGFCRFSVSLLLVTATVSVAHIETGPALLWLTVMTLCYSSLTDLSVSLLSKKKTDAVTYWSDSRPSLKSQSFSYNNSAALWLTSG